MEGCKVKRGMQVKYHELMDRTVVFLFSVVYVYTHIF